MPDKPKIGMYWCASCGGCEESVVDLAEDILAVLDAVDIAFWPVAMDFKKSDVEALDDGALFATLINGAIRTSEQEDMARLLRRKSQVLVAYGSCAQSGGIPALANQFEREHILRYIYDEAPTVVNDEHIRPSIIHAENGFVVSLPEFRNTVRCLAQVVDVDYFIPGCPPTPALLKAALFALLSGEVPPKGAVLAPDTAMCEECARRDSKPQDLAFTSFTRPHLLEVDPNTCFLARGVICMGPATRGGCGALCTHGNMPCTGCFGPTSRVMDQGAKMLSSLASNIDANEEADIDVLLARIPDPVGTLYRYGLAASLLRRRHSHTA